MYKYTGKKGAFLVGIPARDLSDEDVESMTDEQKDLLKAHLKTEDPLYEKAAEDREDRPREAKDEKASSKK